MKYERIQDLACIKRQRVCKKCGLNLCLNPNNSLSNRKILLIKSNQIF